MRLPPLLERELRAGARRPGFFWLRGLLALATTFQGYQLLGSALVPALGAKLLHQIAHLLFVAALLMGLFTADSISRERRDGTLGLLFLTHLTSWQVVAGKLLSRGLTAFLALMGCLPALMLSVLLGGVTAAEATMTGIGLLNTLFVALAAGLWASARFRHRHHVFPITITVLMALVLGPQVLGAALFGLSAPPLINLVSLGGWMAAARSSAPHLAFLVWLAIFHGVGWFFLFHAAATLLVNWQDEPHPQFHQPEPDRAWPASADLASSTQTEEALAENTADRRLNGQTSEPEAAPQASDVTRFTVDDSGSANNQRPRSEAAVWISEPRPWDDDPARWRVQRIGTPEAAIWLAIVLDLLAQFAALGPLLHESGSGDPRGLLCALGTLTILGCSAVLAWAGARFFHDARHQQDLELLLTTPLGPRNILRGQWRVLRRALAWPLALVLAVALPSGLSIIHHVVNADLSGTRYLLAPLLIPLNLALEVLALCWVGMWFGLRGRNMVTSVVGAMSCVQLLPLAPLLVLIGAWVVLQRTTPPLVPALLFFIAKNAGCIVWARFCLSRELRTGVTRWRRAAKSLAFARLSV